MAQDSLKLYYTKEEVAEQLDISIFELKKYTEEFQIPIEIVGQKLKYTSKQVDMLREIVVLLKEDLYTLEGAKKALVRRKEDRQREIEILKKLKGIRELLTILANDGDTTPAST